MATQQQIDRWQEQFAFLKTLPEPDRDLALSGVHFPRLDQGAVAYEFEAACENYLMCVEGGTRAFKRSENGREMLIYTVRPGGTCLLTTQCLLSGGGFPAESVADAPTEMAAIPAPTFNLLMARSLDFRTFVLTDYSRLLASMVSLVDDVAFASVEQKLARRLLADGVDGGRVAKTHQRLADDVGSVREVVSRTLGEWERAGWLRLSRGQIEILDRAALASRRNPERV